MAKQSQDATARVRGLVKSLQDLGVHAGSPSQVIESLKKENADLRRFLKHSDEANTILLKENGVLREWLTECQARKQIAEDQWNEIQKMIAFVEATLESDK